MKNLNEKNQYITNPLPKIHSTLIDINPYINKEVLYLIKVKDDIYKYGVSNDIRNRLRKHKISFKFEMIMKIWLCKNKTVSLRAEAKFKEFTKNNNIQIIYDKHTELFQSNNIENIITVLDNMIESEIKTYDQEHETSNNCNNLNIIDLNNNENINKHEQLTLDMVFMLREHNEKIKELENYILHP
jgi:predicted GIY-YIG superfamily endonuclease